MENSQSRFLRSVVSILTLFSVILSPFLSIVTNAQNQFTGRVLAVDRGDRIRVRLDTLEMTVRLHGIECPDAPEALQEKARAYVERRVRGKRVRVEVRGTGAKQTVYGEVYYGKGISLNTEMVTVGLAKWARQYAPHRTDIAHLEQQARRARRGMWGDPNADNVVLPPAEPTGARTTMVKSDSSYNRMRTPANTRPKVRSAAKTVRAPAQNFPILPATVLAFLLTAAGVSATLFFLSGRQASALPPQVAVALWVGTSIALMIPFLVLLLQKEIVPTVPFLVVCLLTPLIALALFLATRLQHQEQQIRAAPSVDFSDEPLPGIVRMTGQSSAPEGVVHSKVGHIPGIYIREQSFRYEPEPGRRGRHTPHRWTAMETETQAADFRLSNDQGSVRVDASRAVFHPLRVARFYNDIPVESFFAESYSGDVRTEVFFIPVEANLTVWGRCFWSSSPLLSRRERRMGCEPRTGTLIVVEETPNRIFTRRPLWSLFLTLLAITLSFGVVLCITAPERVTAWGSRVELRR